MKKTLYCQKDHNIFISYPDHLQSIMSFILKRIKIEVTKPIFNNGSKFNAVILDEYEPKKKK